MTRSEGCRASGHTNPLGSRNPPKAHRSGIRASTRSLPPGPPTLFNAYGRRDAPATILRPGRTARRRSSVSLPPARGGAQPGERCDILERDPLELRLDPDALSRREGVRGTRLIQLAPAQSQQAMRQPVLTRRRPPPAGTAISLSGALPTQARFCAETRPTEHASDTAA